MIYKEAILKLEEQLFSLHPQAKTIYSTINNLRDLTPVELTHSKEEKLVIKLVFDKNAAATEQVKFALVYLNKASKITEIEKAIKEFDPEFNKGLNTPIDKLKKSESIDIYNPNNSNHSVFYGLKEWFNQDGTLKEEYK